MYLGSSPSSPSAFFSIPFKDGIKIAALFCIEADKGCNAIFPDGGAVLLGRGILADGATAGFVVVVSGFVSVTLNDGI
ncbi:hypothetical protein D3C87_1812780 [compost metagenome]